jgi:hypothetical protein
MNSKIHTIGRLVIQIDWESTGWFYISRKDEKINMKFFIGTIEYDGGSLSQIIIGRLAISWGWKHE